MSFERTGPFCAQFEADIESVARTRADLLLLPKADDPKELRGLRTVPMSLVPLVETARAVETVSELARAHPRIERLAFGSLDLALDLGLEVIPDSDAEPSLYAYARSRLVFASRAAGLAPPLDGVYPRVSDRAGLEVAAASAKNSGFGGMLSIHPAQLPIIEAAFAPSSKQLERARKVLEVAARAANEGRAVAQFEGHMIDAPVIRWAQSVVESVSEDSREPWCN